MDVIKNILFTPSILIQKVLHEKNHNELSVERVFPRIAIYDIPLFYFSDPTYIVDNIYLGNVLNASNYSISEKYKITSILNITEEVPNYYNDRCLYLNVKIKDINSGDITEHFKEIIDFFKKSNGNLLVHCFMGASRSVIITMLYLIHFKNMSPEVALFFIKSRRPNINPNTTFYNQFCQYYKTHYLN